MSVEGRAKILLDEALAWMPPAENDVSWSFPTIRPAIDGSRACASIAVDDMRGGSAASLRGIGFLEVLAVAIGGICHLPK